MSFLPTRGLGQKNLVSYGLGGLSGVLFPTSTAGALALTGVLMTTFIPAAVDTQTNAYGRRFFGTFYGPRGQGHR